MFDGEEELESYGFPLIADSVPSGIDGLDAFVGKGRDEIVSILASRLSFPNSSPLQPLADRILSGALEELAVFRPDWGANHQAWFTFGADRYPVHLPVGAQACLGACPANVMPALGEFVATFGGLADGHLPPGAHFLDAGSAFQVRRSDPQLPWGPTGRWEGAQVIYQGGSGNLIVASAGGPMGLWRHEFGCPAEEDDGGLESAFTEIAPGIEALIEQYLAYIEKPFTDSARHDSPFCF